MHPSFLSVTKAAELTARTPELRESGARLFNERHQWSSQVSGRLALCAGLAKACCSRGAPFCCAHGPVGSCLGSLQLLCPVMSGALAGTAQVAGGAV